MYNNREHLYAYQYVNIGINKQSSMFQTLMLIVIFPKSIDTGLKIF